MVYCVSYLLNVLVNKFAGAVNSTNTFLFYRNHLFTGKVELIIDSSMIALGLLVIASTSLLLLVPKTTDNLGHWHFNSVYSNVQNPVITTPTDTIFKTRAELGP